MKLTSCPRCERHVLVEAASCPFCGTRLGTTSALGRAVMTVVLGIAMSSCTNEVEDDDYGGADYTGPGPMTETTGQPMSTDSTSSGTAGATSQGPTSATTSGSSSDGGGADYTGPGPTGEPPADTSSGTDTGTSTSGSSSDGGGADYTGPGVGPK